MPTQEIFLAIDAGQSHTEAVAVDSAGNQVYGANGGASYAQDGSPLVDSTFDQALGGLPAAARTSVRRVLLGATGHDIPGRSEALAASMRSRFPQATLQIVGDAELLLLAYAGDGPGGVLIAGTGCIALGRWNGRRATAGGYGYLLGDEGGGTGLVLDAVRRCLRCADGDTSLPGLAKDLCAWFGVSHIRRVPGVLYAGGPLDVRLIAGAAPLVAAAATRGEHLAQDCVNACGNELAWLVSRLGQSLELPAGAGFPLFLCGGLWRMGEALLGAFRAGLPPAVDWMPRRVEGSPALEAARYIRALGSSPDGPL